ncbi:MAG: hypothetical protein ACOH18_04460 [Candidatus Saccharimonadaceae bacterium]
MRYIILVIINLPILMLAFLNLATKYKLKKIDRRKFYGQTLIWFIILVVIVVSFPAYNLMAGNPVLDSSELSLFDITQTTVIVALIYVVNNQRQKIERNEKRTRDLHQELSLRLSEDRFTK